MVVVAAVEVLATVLATVLVFIRNWMRVHRGIRRHADLCAAAEGAGAL